MNRFVVVLMFMIATGWVAVVQFQCNTALHMNAAKVISQGPPLHEAQSTDGMPLQLPSSDEVKDKYFKSCEGGNAPAKYFLQHLKADFYNLENKRRDGLDVFLSKFGSHWPQEGLVMLDIGAGCYASGSDSVLAIKFAKQFGCFKNRFIAFEPQADILPQTLECIKKALFPDRLCVVLECAAFSNTTQLLKLAGSENIASLATHLADTAQQQLRQKQKHKDYKIWKANKRYTKTVDVIAWDLTTYSRLHNIDFIDLLKIDTEGHDFAVIQGALAMLQAKRIMAVVMEVSDKMNSDFWSASYGDHKAVFHETSNISEPNVKSVVKYMLNLGYYGFWLGTKRLVPLSGLCWHDSMEICGNPHGLLGSGICWFDIIFIQNTGYGTTIIDAIQADSLSASASSEAPSKAPSQTGRGMSPLSSNATLPTMSTMLAVRSNMSLSIPSGLSNEPDYAQACQREAWATLLSSGVNADWDTAKTYLLATLVLRDSVRKFEICRPGRKFFVVHNLKSSDTDEGKPEQWAVAQLQKHGFQDLPLSMEVPYQNEKRPELAVGWLKLALFNLTYLDRIVCLDGDMLALGPLDQALFPRGPMMGRPSLITSSMPNPNSRRAVNVGVMSIGPSSQVFHKIMAELHSFDNRTDRPDNQDQGWVDMFFRKWGDFGGVYEETGFCVNSSDYRAAGLYSSKGPRWCFHLPEYNTYVGSVFLSAVLARTSPKLLHWSGWAKPWCVEEAHRSVFDKMWWTAAEDILRGTLDGNYNGSLYASCSNFRSDLKRRPRKRDAMVKERISFNRLWAAAARQPRWTGSKQPEHLTKSKSRRRRRRDNVRRGR